MEYIKHKVKEFSIEFAKSKQNIIKNRTKSKQNIIKNRKQNHIEKEIDKIEMTHYEKLDYDRLKMLEPELNEICESKTKGFQIMSEAKLIENGDKNPK